MYEDIFMFFWMLMCLFLIGIGFLTSTRNRTNEEEGE